MSITTEIASTLLGKKVSGSETYDPSILVAVPRYENREQYNIDPNSLPFVGYDIWHGYEFSTMTNTGIPVTRVIKLKYDCSSEYIVESKSLKLYLNSYNMDRYGDTVKECLDICKNAACARVIELKLLYAKFVNGFYVCRSCRSRKRDTAYNHNNAEKNKCNPLYQSGFFHKIPSLQNFSTLILIPRKCCANMSFLLTL